MSNYTKSSVELLTIIENIENKLTVYSEFDGSFQVGDKLYIAVSDITNNDVYDELDSIHNSTGYELLNKVGNRLTLDIDYDSLSINRLNDSGCFIGRIYMDNITLNKGSINGSIIRNATFDNINRASIEWKQSIIFSSSSVINNLNFNTKYDNDKLIMKTIINTKNEIESFYTKNNYGVGLSIINISDNIIELDSCNINGGVFNNCAFSSSLDSNEINDGIIENSVIGSDYIINGGSFINTSLLDDSIIWNNGKWDNSDDGDEDNKTPFKPYTWSDGVWVNGTVSNNVTWKKGRFLAGTFSGISWESGEFNGGLFNATTWLGGEFNGGEMKKSTWENGIFNNGIMTDTVWFNGTFNSGSIKSSDDISHRTWAKGEFNGGIISKMSCNDITVNGGLVNDCEIETGTINGGKLVNTTWNNGIFYDGEFEDGTWNNGIFNNGIFKSSLWNGGVVYDGVFIDMNSDTNYWVKGIIYNGTFNNMKFESVEFNNGIVNNSIVGTSTETSIIEWNNGIFNSGVFGDNSVSHIWNNGKFYSGTFRGVWNNGTFYTGDDNDIVNIRYKTNNAFKPYTESGLKRKYSTKQKRTPRERKRTKTLYNT